jgi:hypothetical protein
MSQRGEVEANLAEMDGKLRELQHELSVLTTAPERDSPPPPHREAPPPRRETATTPASDRSDLPLAAAAADQARAIIAGAQAEATRIVGEAAQRVTAIAAQIDDLQRLRDELERSARALVEEYAAALSHVGEPAAVPPTAPQEPPRSPGESPASQVHPPLW